MQENYNTQRDPSFQTNSSKWKEGYSISVMICVGIIGLGYVLNTIHKRESGSVKTFPFTYEEESRSPLGLYLPKDQAPQKPLHQKQVVPKNKQLIIKGELEANEFLQFIIESYDEMAAYELQIGIGNFIPVDKKTIIHSFNHPGHYDIILKASFKGETRLLHQETIYISKAIEIAQDARREIDY